MPVDEPSVGFGTRRETDVAFQLYSSSPKSLLYYCRQNGHEERTLTRFNDFADRNGLYSGRDGLPKFHYLCASLLDAQGSVFADVNGRWQGLIDSFRHIVMDVEALLQAEGDANGFEGFEALWRERYSSLAKAQEVARIRFRLPEYSVLFIRGLRGKFGQCCMVHDKYVFINAQRDQTAFAVEATFHELLHQLLAGHRYATEGKFFTGRFLWQPRRAMAEEIVIPCLEMQLCDDPKEREKKRTTVLHLDESHPFLRPFKSLFPKILRDWEEEYMRSRDTNLQDFINHMTRKYLNLVKFMASVRQVSESVEKTRKALAP
jgi:hypothetical protein